MQFPFTKEMWAGLTPLRRVIIIGIIAVGAFILVSFLKTFLSSVTGVQEGAVYLPSDISSSGYAKGGGGFENPLAMRDMAVTSSVAPTYNSSYDYEPPVVSGGTGTYDENKYEARSYSAQFKTYEYDPTCNAVETWKAVPYVVFQYSMRTERTCRYQFKVEKAHAEELLAKVKALGPQEVTVHTESVKEQFTQHDSRLTILLRRDEMLKQSLESSTQAYDELVSLSKTAQDVETLAKVMDKKLANIERLTRDRITLAAEIDALQRSTAQLGDSVDYVMFDVAVEKYEIMDTDLMKDSWVRALQNFTNNLMQTIQSLTLGLLENLLVLALGAVYLIIILVVAKYGWREVRRFWRS